MWRRLIADSVRGRYGSVRVTFLFLFYFIFYLLWARARVNNCPTFAKVLWVLISHTGFKPLNYVNESEKKD
jgi:hypothetical protein